MTSCSLCYIHLLCFIDTAGLLSLKLPIFQTKKARLKLSDYQTSVEFIMPNFALFSFYHE